MSPPPSVSQPLASHREEFIKKYGDEPWVAPQDEQWYWYQTKTPDDLLSVPKSVFLDPFMQFIGLSLPPEDPSFGRYTLPFSPQEKQVRENRRYTCWDARVFLDKNRKPVDHATSEWLWYQVWWDEEAAKRTGANVDLLFCHGLAEYGGSIAPHASRFLEAGYRLIVPDLPSHGRSSGLHAYITNFEDLAHAVHEVLSDVIKRDASAGRRQRDAVVAGQSMGGFACVLYALLYHTPAVRTPAIPPGTPRPNLLGIVPLCPMLAIAPESRPPMAIELLARMINSFAGRLPMAPAQKGKNTEDRWFEDQFRIDPQTYHGNLRSSTGLSILDVLDFTDRVIGELSVRFLVLHGEVDRVTSPEGSRKMFERAKSTDKQIKVYPKTEHYMLRVGRDEEDDKTRQEIMSDMIKFIERNRKQPSES